MTVLVMHLQKTELKIDRDSTSDAVLAETSLGSPRKLVILIIKMYIYRIKVAGKKVI